MPDRTPPLSSSFACAMLALIEVFEECDRAGPVDRA
jgi:hypothetical protein